MIFFSSFSSMLPYILYLSVIWLCVLAGFRGNIFHRERMENTSEKTIDVRSFTLSKTQFQDETVYQFTTDRSETAAIEADGSFSINSAILLFKEIFFKPSGFKKLRPGFSYSFLLRGPPAA